MQPGQRHRCSDPRQPEDRGADVYSGLQGCGGLGAAGGHDNKAMSHKHLRKGLGSSKGETQPAPSEELRTQSPSARRSVATGQGRPSGPWDAARPGRGGHGWVWRPLMVLAADSTRLRDRRRALHPRTQPENSLCMPDFLGTPSPADPSDAASLRATVTAGDAGGAVRASPHTALTACTSGDVEATCIESQLSQGGSPCQPGTALQVPRGEPSSWRCART